MAVCWGVRAEKQGQLVELGGDQSPSPKAPPRRGKGAKEISGEEQMPEKQWRRRGVLVVTEEKV